ncbi:MAG TPA: hypothetical protein DCW83_14190 [Saprospirales bacterium]|jgi:plastocyanin|nr:hypothetical protein [Saprospirales bacterium]
MAANIKLKRSAVSGKIPGTGDLDYGEVALNYADGRLYYKTSSNTVSSISGGGAETDSAAPTSSLQDGSLWWDAVNGKLKIYYGEPTPAAAAINLAATQTNAQSGDYLFTGSDRSSTFSSDPDPTIYIYKGDTLNVVNSATAIHPFFLVSQLSLSNSYDALYNIPGVTNNGGYNGTTISYQFNSVGTYYYICSAHPSMQGQIIVVDAADVSAQWVDASASQRGFTGSAGAIFQGENVPANPTAGQIWYNSNTGKSYIYYTNPSTSQSQWVLQADPTVSDGDRGYSGSVGYTGSQGVYGPRVISFQAPDSGDQQTLMYTDRQMIVSEVRSIVSYPGSSVSMSLKYDSDRSSSGTLITSGTINSTTSGNVGSISNATIDAGRWIWAEVTNPLGLVDEVSINVSFNG